MCGLQKRSHQIWSNTPIFARRYQSTHLLLFYVCVCVFCSVIIPQAKCFFFVVFFAFCYFLVQISPLLFGPFVVLHFLTVIKRGDTRRRDILLYSRSARTVSKHTQNLNKSTFLKECCLSSPIIIIIIESRRETDNGHEEK